MEEEGRRLPKETIVDDGDRDRLCRRPGRVLLKENDVDDGDLDHDRLYRRRGIENDGEEEERVMRRT